MRIVRRALSLFPLAAVLTGGCDGGSVAEPPGNDQTTLALVVSNEPIQLVAPTSVLIQLLVIGASGEPVTITAPGAPGFVSLSGSLLTLAPDRPDVGTYAVDLVAKTTTQQATGTLHVEVTRTNTGPMWLPIPIIKGTETDGSARPVVKSASFYALVCDDEGDNITLQVEVVPAGAAFAGTATTSRSVDFAVTPPLSYELPDVCAEFDIPLTGLAPGDYDIAAHAVDALGAPDPYGWVPFRGFTLAP